MSDDLVGPPQAIEAERAVLGAALHTPRAFAEALSILSDEDFYRPAHRALWQLMRKVSATGAVADPIAVVSALSTADKDTQRNLTAVLVGDIYGALGVSRNVAYYAEQVAAAGLRRRLIETAEGVAQRAREMEDATEAADWAVTNMTLARDTQLTPDASDVDVHELLDEHVEQEWVIPGLLARGDRLILTASEGLGKSTLLRQIAVMAAAGLHPFTTEHIPPVRVFVMDCENGRMLSRDRYRPLVLQSELQHRPVQDRLRIDIRPSGLNLLSSSDASMLLRSVERVKPDLLLIGPIYRLHEDDPNDEKAARRVAAVLDRARAATGCAVITEAHTPHSDGPGGHMLRPFGSSLWKRWPEFGYCLKLTAESDFQARQCKFIPWRGPRDERDWPTGLRAGGEHAVWPWAEVRPESMRFAS